MVFYIQTAPSDTPEALQFDHSDINCKNIKITGIVRQERMWEIKAMPEATLVSLPSALGIIMVFRPKGMAREQTAQVAKVSGIGNTNIAPRKSIGKTSNRKAGRQAC